MKLLRQSSVPADYKQTEIGVIPEDWEVDSIIHQASITTGTKNTQDRITDGRYPFFVRSQTIERINSYSFNKKAMLTAGDGVGTGKVFHYINGKFDYDQRVYNICNFKASLDGFYFYKIFSNRFYDRIMSMTAKSSVDSVRREMIADMVIPLPNPAEQRAIAENGSPVPEFETDEERTSYLVRLPVHPLAAQPVGPGIRQAPDKLPTSSRQVLEALVSAALSRAELQESVGFQDREHFVNEYLNPLLDSGFVERTMPGKPRSPKQQYRLTQKGREALNAE